jgi:chemotaxis protein MotC
MVLAALLALPVLPVRATDLQAGGTGPDPMSLARELSRLQQLTIEGHAEAPRKQVELVRAAARELAAFEVGIWTVARNRQALVKLVLSGSDAAPLEKAIEQGVFPKAEQSLARGALAYARGKRHETVEEFAGLHAGSLAPSLAGHVSLVLAVSLGGTDRARALRYCDEARLLSPGTIVDETALRLSIDLAIAVGDRARFVADARRYLYRFPASLYGRPVQERIARVMALLDLSAAADGRRQIAALGALLPGERRHGFYVELAKSALRSGRLVTARDAAQLALGAAAPRSAAAVAALAIEGAALVPGGERAEAMRRLEEAAALRPAAELAELIAAAREVAAAIDRPAQVAEGLEQPDQGPGGRDPANHHATIIRARAALAGVEKLLERPRS